MLKTMLKISSVENVYVNHVENHIENCVENKTLLHSIFFDFLV